MRRNYSGQISNYLIRRVLKPIFPFNEGPNPFVVKYLNDLLFGPKVINSIGRVSRLQRES
jgi:hypothetical protein